MVMHSFYFLGAAVLASFLVSGCTSNKVLQATGGSRSDGIVNLSYETGLFEDPVINWDQANSVALKRCQAWGYTSAEAFGGVNTQCQAYNGYGQCLRAFITVPYQCANDYAEQPAAPVYAPPAPAPTYAPAAPAPAYAPAAPAQVYAPASPAQIGAPPTTARAYAPPAVGPYDPYAIDP